METYHKINSIQMRYTSGPNIGQFTGEWARPEFAYLELNEWIWREKIDGTNIRVHIQGGGLSTVINFGGRTANAQIPMPLYQKLENLFTTDDALRRIGTTFDDDTLLEGVTLFGEGFGAGIMKGGAYGPVDFILFDVQIGGWWLLEEAVTDIANKLEIKRVPLVGTGTLFDAIELVANDELRSAWAGVTPEGIVAVPEVPLWDRRGERVIAKIKGKDFIK